MQRARSASYDASTGTDPSELQMWGQGGEDPTRDAVTAASAKVFEGRGGVTPPPYHTFTPDQFRTPPRSNKDILPKAPDSGNSVDSLGIDFSEEFGDLSMGSPKRRPGCIPSEAYATQPPFLPPRGQSPSLGSHRSSPRTTASAPSEVTNLFCTIAEEGDDKEAKEFPHENGNREPSSDADQKSETASARPLTLKPPSFTNGLRSQTSEEGFEGTRRLGFRTGIDPTGARKQRVAQAFTNRKKARDAATAARQRQALNEESPTILGKRKWDGHQGP